MPPICRSSLIAVALATVLPSASIAQRLPTRGDVVRLHRLSAHGDTDLVVGRWHLASRDSVLVSAGRSDTGDVFALDRASLAGVDVERGAKAQDATIATFAVAGAVASGVAVVKWCLDDPRACEDRQPPTTDCDTTSRWSLPALLVVGGAIVGGLIGEALAPRRYWEPVILPTELGSTPEGRLRWRVLVGVRLPLPGRRSALRAR